MKIRLASPVLMPDSIVDGEGIRAVLWTQGCLHKCPGCQNPQTHSFDDGFLIDIEEVKEQIMREGIEEIVGCSRIDTYATYFEYDDLTKTYNKLVRKYCFPEIRFIGIYNKDLQLEDVHLEDNEALVLMRMGDDDFHFIRKMPDGKWYHKPGGNHIEEICEDEVFSDYWEAYDESYYGDIAMFIIKEDIVE